MRVTKLAEIPLREDTVDVFGGLNKGARIAGNEFSDMQNMTGENYPTISTRGERGMYKTANHGTLFNADSGWLGWIELEHLTEQIPDPLRPGETVTFEWWGKAVVNGVDVKNGNGDKLRFDSVIQNVVRYNTYVLFFPSKYYLNLASLVQEDPADTSTWYWTDFGSLAVIDSSTTPATVTQPPEMDVYTTSGNRVWGARFGLSAGGEFVNEIYASKLGDKSDFRTGDLSTDGWVASCGVPGYFTGACELNGHPVFFKEDAIFTIYGTDPSNFSISVTRGAGVRLGCARTLAVYNGRAYYRAPNAVNVFDGGAPVPISEKLGDLSIEHHSGSGFTFVEYPLHPFQYDMFNGEGAGDFFNGKYYVCIIGSDTYPNMFVYDADKGFWHREDKYTNNIVRIEMNLYFGLITKILSVKKGTRQSGEDNPNGTISWSVTTGDIGIEEAERRTLTRIDVAVGSNTSVVLKVKIKYEYETSHSVPSPYEQEFYLHANKTYYLPIRPRRLDHFKLELSSTQPVTIYAIRYVYEKGSDMK